jgi:hypothetical protein
LESFEPFGLPFINMEIYKLGKPTNAHKRKKYDNHLFKDKKVTQVLVVIEVAKYIHIYTLENSCKLSYFRVPLALFQFIPRQLQNA